jgi:hypothetical protein
MQPLDKALENRLERIIKDARDVADDARAVLEPLAPLSEQDRSKDVESAPWYHVDGNRINVHHLTPTEKRSAKVGEEA